MTNRPDPTSGVMLPVNVGGKTYADYSWWNATPMSMWSHVEEADYANYDDIWARCWAYIEETGLQGAECHAIWPIAYAVIDAMTRLPADQRTPTQDGDS